MVSSRVAVLWGVRYGKKYATFLACIKQRGHKKMLAELALRNLRSVTCRWKMAVMVQMNNKCV